MAGRVATLSFATEELVAAAYLHDVLEDCQVTHDELEKAFGIEVASLVDLLTKKGDGNRTERLTRYFETLGAAPSNVHVVKALDRIDNLGDLALLSGNEEFKREYVAETHRLSLFISEAGRDLLNEMQRATDRVLNTLAA